MICIFGSVIGCSNTESSMKGGIMFVDISVPRNVHPDCNEINGAYCYNVDNLKEVVERNTGANDSRGLSSLLNITYFNSSSTT
jgi:glutamyl-tRNA reductase